MHPVAQICLNLALTVLIECVLAWLLFRSRRVCYITLLCNMLTNPPLNVILLLAMRHLPLYWALLCALEIAVVCVEAYLYRDLADLPKKKSYAVSLLLNGASLFCGSAILVCLSRLFA